ncbi:MAG: aminotransferase class I/II-fold pyridoxal phosphate-dependent enzyme [Nitrospinota bacterium]|nr:MAG: aminotransferase class I/II-fold pyridoxal phosphate-dependent enzyme [Nitrospinota bacterium]
MTDGYLGFSTRAVHGGEERRKPEHALTTPIFQTSTYSFQNTAELIEYMEGRIEREEYGRYGNPTQRVAEKKIAALDGAEDALLFSSGMAAITTIFFGMLSRESHLILTSDGYRRTRQFCSTLLRKLGVDVSVIDIQDGYEKLENSIQENTRLIFSESPTNPYLHVLDLERVVAIAKRHRVKVVIDSTFATPYNQQPLRWGVDLVVHSATKYLGGHNDLLAGVVTGSSYLIGALRDVQAMLGGIIDPHSAYLLLRGLKSFSLRLAKQNENGQRIAEFLAQHPRVKAVYYPGLPSHPHHAIATRQMRGFGGVVSFEIDGDLETTSRFIDRLKIPYIAPSLGGVESLVEQPALMSYYEMDPEERRRIGITDELVRLSLGIEDAEDLIADLQQALDGI